MTDRRNRREFMCDGTFIAGSLLVGGAAGAVAAAEKKGTLRVGAYVMDVSPKELPVAVNGGFTPRYYKTICDPICVRVIIVDDGKEQFVFSTLDVCLFAASFADKIRESASKKTGIAKERISFSATHTHYAPGIFDEEYTKYNAKYMDSLLELVPQAILKAKERLQPAKFGWTTAREPRHVFCRRWLMKAGTAWDEPKTFVDAPRNLAQMNPGYENPNSVTRTGIPDQTIYILSFQTPAGKPLALLANYSTHYAGSPNGVSADYFGVFAREVKKLLGAGDDFVAMMTNGTSGDTNCRDFSDKNQPKYDLEIVGKHVAEKTFEAYGKIQYSESVSLHSKQVVLRLANRKPTAGQVKEAQDFLVAHEKDTKLKATTRAYAQRTITISTWPNEVDVPLQAIQLGDVGICTIPNEVFSFTGHDLRVYSPFQPTFIIGLANGYNGYLPTAEQFELGGYTTWRGTSYLECEAEPKIRGQLLTMLRELDSAR